MEDFRKSIQSSVDGVNSRSALRVERDRAKANNQDGARAALNLFNATAHEFHKVPIPTIPAMLTARFRTMSKGYDLDIPLGRFCEWSAEEWGLVKHGHLHWMDNFPERPSVDTFVNLFRFFKEAYVQRDSLQNFVSNPSAHAEYTRLRRQGMSEEDAKATAGQVEELSVLQRRIRDARQELQAVIDTTEVARNPQRRSSAPTTRRKVSEDFDAEPNP